MLIQYFRPGYLAEGDQPRFQHVAAFNHGTFATRAGRPRLATGNATKHSEQSALERRGLFIYFEAYVVGASHSSIWKGIEDPLLQSMATAGRSSSTVTFHLIGRAVASAVKHDIARAMPELSSMGVLAFIP